ncbi:MAG: DUF2806 domain-containing protein [Vampirovibrio sp.]|nr:DUF2806 domain-containing protein [Vampirovibrio sp.]
MEVLTTLPAIAVAKALSKPADTLIKKFATACGVLYQPYHKVKMAKAEATALVIKTQGQIESDRLIAIDRLIHNEERCMANEESIITKALPLLDETADAKNLDDDWLQNFITKSRNTSDEVLQETWARILAGEVNQPNSFSKKVVNLVSELGKRDAELFTLLASFTVTFFGANAIFTHDWRDPFLLENGLNFNYFKHLDYLGLISLSTIDSYKLKFSGHPSNFYEKARANLKYFNRDYLIEFSSVKTDLEKGEVEVSLIYGFAMLTQAGEQLLKICTPEPIEGFEAYLKTELAKQQITLILEPTE